MKVEIRIVNVLAMLVICVVCGLPSFAGQAEDANSPDDEEEMGIAIELTKLELTDLALEFSYRIRNGSDREAWVCTEVSSIPFEMFLTPDAQTLLIRKRLDVPTSAIWRSPPAPGRYTRLKPGEDRLDTLRIDLPAATQFVYASITPEMITRTVRHLVLEIGYYGEDLPALIHSILAVADQFNIEAMYLHPELRKTYFRGLSVRSALGGFDRIDRDPYADGYVYIPYSRQALTGEKVLRMEISGIAIPYTGWIENEIT